MIKKCFFSLIAIFFCLIVSGQQQVKWSFSSKRIDNKTFELHFTAIVQEPWHIYSQSTPEGGPKPTTFTFSKNPLVVLSGKVKENGDMVYYHDKIFDVDVYAYTGKVDFVQRVQLKSKVKTTVSGTLEFMACTKEQCLTPEKVKFSLKLE